MEPTSAGESAPSPIKFRTGKKRKAYRQRTDDTETSIAIASNDSRESSAIEAKGDEDDASVLAALRLRNARKGRLRGVGFSTSARPEDETQGEGDRALVLRDQDDSQDAALPAIGNRFTHQTGLLADLNDRHMYDPLLSSTDSGHGLIIQGWSI